MQALPNFPVAAHLPAIKNALTQNPCVLLEAAPGAGKSTLVPFHLATESDWSVLVVQPRRLAATLTAQFVAKLTDSPLGEHVGYHVRYDKKDQGACRVLFLTEGMLLRYAVEDPQLSRWQCVILDEFHERHLATDVSFAMLRRLQQSTRPDLRLCLMSATLDGQDLRKALPEAPFIQVPGRTFPISLSYATKSPQAIPAELLAPSILAAFRERPDHGNALVFLPGTRDILEAQEKLAPMLAPLGVKTVALTAHTSQQATRELYQDQATRFVILSTNVAETSVTLPNVSHVFDAGLAKVAHFDPANRFNLLQTRRVTQDSCIQRMGRAGRTREGFCVRLYSEQDFMNRPARLEPELMRLDLTQTLLELHSIFPGESELETSLPWLVEPPADKVAAGIELLQALRLLDRSRTLTRLGRDVSRWSWHPRLGTFYARMREYQVQENVALAATSLLEQEGIARNDALPPVHESSDVLYQLHLLLRVLRRENLSPSESRYVDVGKMQTIQADVQRLLPRGAGVWPKDLSPAVQEAIQRALLDAFSDRVARVLKKPAGSQIATYALCQGRAAKLGKGSVCQDEDLILALQLQTVGDSAEYVIGLATQVDRKAILSESWPLYRTEVTEQLNASAAWQGTKHFYYGQLLLAEEKLQAPPKGRGADLVLFLRQNGLAGFSDGEAFERYHVRREVLMKNNCIGPDDFPDFTGEMFELFLEAICEDVKSLDALYQRGLENLILEQLGYEAGVLLTTLAPLHFTFPNGKRTSIVYEKEKAPWMGERIQYYFGLSETPCIAKGRQRVTLHLQAPNQRPMQVTQDLAGFWKNTYPEVKQELKRKYPRHRWPDDPWIEQETMPMRRERK